MSDAPHPTRQSRRRKRQRRHHSTRLHLGAAFAGAGPVGTSGIAPSLTMTEPESAKSALLSGSLVTGLHVLGFSLLVGLAILHPSVQDLVIPVQIMKDTPSPKLPAPRNVTPRKIARPATALAPQPVQAPQPVGAAQVSAEALDMSDLAPVAVPSPVERREVESRRVAVRPTDVAVPRVAPVAPVGTVAVRDVDRQAPQVVRAGPRAVAPTSPVQVNAPEAFANYEQVAEGQPTAAAPSSAARVVEGAFSGVAVDTGVADSFLDGSGSSGGAGVGEGKAGCMQTQSVAEYLEIVKSKMKAQWTVPEGTPPNEVVKLGFELDVSGSPRRIEVQQASNAALGRSAVDAMRLAGPFPSMDDDVRCLASMRLVGIFDNPL